MVPVSLANGRQYVSESSASYRVYAHRFGNMEIERISDGYTVFFQGDDCSVFRWDLEFCATPLQLDRLCSEYDEVMQPPNSHN